MPAPIQLLCIHGGMTFHNRADYVSYLRTCQLSLEKRIKWNDKLQTELGDDFVVIHAKMPLSDHAKYAEWKIIFEKYLALLTPPFVFVGKSLGGIFLAKYLSENRLAVPALSAYCIAPPFDNTSPVEDIVGGFRLGKSLSRIEKNTARTVLCFSENDPIVPIAHAEKYRAKLPRAEFHIFNNKNGHFFVEDFPEIITMLKQDAQRWKRT